MWNIESMLNFKSGLQDREIVDKIGTLIACNSIGTHNIAKEIQNILAETISSCKVKTKKKSANNINCNTKNSLKTLANKMKGKPEEDRQGV